MTRKTTEKTRARELQALTGSGYQSCVQAIRRLDLGRNLDADALARAWADEEKRAAGRESKTVAKLVEGMSKAEAEGRGNWGPR